MFGHRGRWLHQEPYPIPSAIALGCVTASKEDIGVLVGMLGRGEAPSGFPGLAVGWTLTWGLQRVCALAVLCFALGPCRLGHLSTDGDSLGTGGPLLLIYPKTEPAR